MKKIIFLMLLTISINLCACGGDVSETSVHDNTVENADMSAENESSVEKTEDNTANNEATTENKFIAASETENLASQFANFEITSANLHNGAWDDIISNTDKGENKSPQLSWEPVEGASLYMIYMVDTSMQYWIHWKSYNITETNLSEGWAPNGEYVGPWPPAGGTHTYEIYVIALKNPIDRMKGSLDGQNMKFANFIESADTDVDGNTGNIIACAHLTGTFTN